MFPIKTKLFMFFSCLIFVTLTFGCSKTEETKESNWEELISSNSKLETNQEEMSEDILKQIKVPKYSTIPFEVKKVQIMPGQTDVTGKDPMLISISFFGEKDAVFVSNLFVKENPPLEAQETVKLSNGIEAHWDESGEAKVLSWQDREGNVLIDLAIRSAPGENNDFTLDDMLKMANSFE